MHDECREPEEIESEARRDMRGEVMDHVRCKYLIETTHEDASAEGYEVAIEAAVRVAFEAGFDACNELWARTFMFHERATVEGTPEARQRAKDDLYKAWAELRPTSDFEEVADRAKAVRPRRPAGSVDFVHVDPEPPSRQR